MLFRFQRERLSLYSTSNSRYSVRRSKSMGTVSNDVATKPNGSVYLKKEDDSPNVDIETGRNIITNSLGIDNGAFSKCIQKLEETSLDGDVSADTVKKKETIAYNHSNDNDYDDDKPLNDSNHQTQHVPRTIITVADSHINRTSEEKDSYLVHRYISPPVTRKYNENDLKKWSSNIPQTLSECDVSEKESHNQCNNFLCVP